MNKRAAYPIFIVSAFILINVALRLINYGITNEGGSPQTIMHIYNIADFILVLIIPVILYIEQKDNTKILRYVMLYLIYAVYNFLINITYITQILDSDGVLWSVPLYLILGAIVYIGFEDDKYNSKFQRIGRSILLSGIVHLGYLFIMPSNIERIIFTYDMMYLNPLPFLVMIMQMLLLDDVLLESKQKLDESRVTLTDN